MEDKIKFYEIANILCNTTSETKFKIERKKYESGRVRRCKKSDGSTVASDELEEDEDADEKNVLVPLNR
jgi:hypothetical protein